MVFLSLPSTFIRYTGPISQSQASRDGDARKAILPWSGTAVGLGVCVGGRRVGVRVGSAVGDGTGVSVGTRGVLVDVATIKTTLGVSVGVATRTTMRGVGVDGTGVAAGVLLGTAVDVVAVAVFKGTGEVMAITASATLPPGDRTSPGLDALITSAKPPATRNRTTMTNTPHANLFLRRRVLTGSISSAAASRLGLAASSSSSALRGSAARSSAAV
jgi:hypothetical protein